MSLETLLNENTVIYALGSFFTGMASVILYLNLKVFFKKSPYEIDNSLAEAVVSEYSTRLDEFKRIIGELKAKVDTIELLALQRPTSQASTDAVAAAASANVTANDLLINRNDSISRDANQISRSESQIFGGYQTDVMSSAKNITPPPQQPLVYSSEKNTPFMRHNTPDYILKLLSDKPRTSREIQNAIGRTREHTSRLMRKLYERNLVGRGSNSKPFKYTITDAGRRQLLSHNNTPHEITSTPDMDIHSEPAPTQLNVATR